jgi:hypothetical protein
MSVGEIHLTGLFTIKYGKNERYSAFVDRIIHSTGDSQDEPCQK